MEFNDDVYGQILLSDGLLVDLVSSTAIQRLKEVSQAGASSLVRPGRTVTRYEHSLGVMALTGRLGGSDTEQAAGLLQDVSHTAFSHTADYVFGDRSEAFHERIFASVVNNSDIPQILMRYDLTWEELFRPENLIRVDVSAPLLCADRIDYTLRDLLRLKYITTDMAQGFLSTLTFLNGKISVADVDQASAFVRWYRHLVGEVFMNPLELFAHDELARILRAAMDEGALTEMDLQGTDPMVIAKIKKSDTLRADLAELECTRAVRVGPYPGARQVYSKARVIDPPVLSDGEVRPLSSMRPETSVIWDEVLLCAKEGILVSRAP